jgi:hypothetical protein
MNQKLTFGIRDASVRFGDFQAHGCEGSGKVLAIKAPKSCARGSPETGTGGRFLYSILAMDSREL